MGKSKAIVYVGTDLAKGNFAGLLRSSATARSTAIYADEKGVMQAATA
jgi:hypothetical protein